MPTIVSHAAVPLALGIGLGKNIVSRRLLIAGVFSSAIPDLDAVSFLLSIPYASNLGHRGFTHSILLAACIALTGVLFSEFLRTTKVRSFIFLFLATVSHSVLDSFTSGGLGVAFLWPWSPQRFFMPFPIIRVSPLAISHFLSSRGIAVIVSELKWIWLPSLFISFATMKMRIFMQRFNEKTITIHNPSTKSEIANQP